ncbi:AI-2E family transporter [Niveibacterium sp. 24ML]|uniref:AI-2E family transporter n=1 Tax=Niveibacterium sp. 24ML TaxID=2985512 RepID=UPI002271A3B2|nr:AI-2E family transporter [Niveibacterium sp. 24ML]MCX9155479.1 AI-2E family transporter [Niveibacterium sp. 24ML]
MTIQPSQRFENFAQLALCLALLAGCWLVLAPFIVTILFAMIIASSTWPLYQRLLGLLGGRRSVAALLMCTGFILAVVLPLIMVAGAATDGMHWLLGLVRARTENGPLHVPDWLRGIPMVGEAIANHLQALISSREELAALGRKLFDPARTIGLQVVSGIGIGVVQVSLAIFVLFFLYRDGPQVLNTLERAIARLYGAIGLELLDTAQKTVFGVMVGMVGTAAAQSLVAGVGFAVAGVPAPILLAALVFFLSMVPVGPPLVWGGAAFWLYDRGDTGWAIFMVLYGVLAISSVDNIVKPLLIARTSSLPLLIAVLGVFGGVLAFGLVGVFLGPTLLALGISLTQRWLDLRVVSQP